MADEIEISVTVIENNIEVITQPTDEVIDISVTDNADQVTINVTPTVIEININKNIPAENNLVTSVNTRVGDVVITATDVGLGNVDNTGDFQKPVSDDAQALFNVKADLIDGLVPETQLPVTALSVMSGLSQGGVLSINTDTAKFDVSAGFGYIVNGHTNPDVPIKTRVAIAASTANVLPNIGSTPQTFVSIDINGVLNLTPNPLTPTERRNFIRLGVIIHLNNTTIEFIDNQPTVNIEVGGQVQDLLEAFGFRSLSGNRIFPVAANLKIKKELGKVFKAGANFRNLSTQPHTFTLAAQDPITFRYRTQTGAEGSDITDINPGIYDNNGTVTAMPATATLASIQRIFIFQDGLIRIQLGQRFFNNLNEAITAINSDVFITDSDISENGLYLGAIVMIRGTTALNNLAQAVFVPSNGVSANGSTSAAPLGYTAEDAANKQNSLAVDGTGAKYPTVDALKNGVIFKITIAQIRGLTGDLPNNNLYTTDLGQEGNWYYDATDTTSSDDTGVVLVTSDGKRIKREFKDNIIQIGWFGSSLNLDAALQTIATSGYTSVKLKNNTTYTLTTQINCTSDLTLLGSGSIINSAVTINFNFTPSSLRFTLDGVFINLDVDTKDRSNAINTFPNYFNGQLYGENNRNSSRAIVDIQNFANQTEGVVNGDPAFILHHYADRKMVQIDNVGAGDIMTLVNARNPIRRKDKASDYVGTGNYLNYRFVSPTDPSFIEQSGFFVDSDFRQVLTGSRTNSNSRAFTTWNNKVDDGFYAFFHRTTNSHANIDHWGGGSNDLGVTKVDAIRFLTDINYSRFKFQNTLTNGIAIEALQGPITLLPNNSNKTVNLYGRIEFPNGFVGSFQVNKSDDAQNAFNFNIVNRHANILNLGNGTVDRFRLKYDSANDRIKQEVVSGAGGFLIEALSGELLLKGTTSVNILGSLKISTAPIDSAGDYNVITRNSSTGIIEKISTAAIISANIVTNTTTAQLSAASLNTTYPSAQLGFQVNCISISSGALVYQKSSTGWFSQAITVVT